jgi:dolichol kinase
MIKHIGRKFFHFFGGIGLLSLYWLLGRRDALIGYVLIILAVFALDMTRLKVLAFQRFIQTRFGSFIRENEANKLTGIVPYVLGIGLTLFFYQAGIATAAIVFLACGDVMATTVGERYGRTKIVGEKSLEGTLAFVAAAILSGVLLNLTFVPLPFGLLLAGAIVAAGVELLPLPFNDNLTIPVISGGVMELVARAAGCF